MASISARLTVIGENGYGEPEQDANSALTELDKGIRSNKIGDQSEAIVRFPRLFEKYPFPILINSACLKLAELFRTGNNFLRLCILKVMQQTDKHLDKILNVEEFVRRIFSVIHSNDPLARALTLRTLGSIAVIIPEWKNVHHSIRVSLDSHDKVELEAAIFSVGKFAAQSKTFASNIYGKIGQMIEGLATPVDIKLQLISIFQHMHHEDQTTTLVRQLCANLLPKYPATEFVIVILNTLTKLSAASFIPVNDQVQLLLRFLCTDERTSVKVAVLKNLKYLADTGSRFWNKENLEAMAVFADQTSYAGLKFGALDVLASLACSDAVIKFNVTSNSVFIQLCNNSCYEDDLLLASKAIQLLTHLTVWSHQHTDQQIHLNLFENAILAIESFLLAATSSPTSPNVTTATKLCLSCAVILCESKADVCEQFADSFGTLIKTTSGPNTELLCEALAAMGNREASALLPVLPSLTQKLKNTLKSDELQKSAVVIFTLLFQALQNEFSDLSTEIPISDLLESLDLWACYKVGRQASRYGYHNYAAAIFAHLSNQVSSEHFHFWLVGLWELSLAESCVQTKQTAVQKVDHISDAVTHYMKGISAFKAATIPTNLLHFQLEYVRLRVELLQAHYQLARTCTSLKTSPPPAIAATLAAATRDELQKCGRITMQLRKCVREFRMLGDQYGRLYQSVFDADPITLLNIQVLQHNCFLIAQAIDNIALKVQNVGVIEEDSLSELSLGSLKKNGLCTTETRRMVLASQEAMSYLSSVNQSGETHKLIGNKQVDRLMRVSQILVVIPLCIPRYFFQSLQSTSIKLAISPQPRAPGEPITIQSNSHFALKVEGVIQHGARKRMFRKVSSIILNVSSVTQASNRPHQTDSKTSSDATNSMTQTVEPHNDYFNAQFLLAFPTAGVHIITVEVSVVDELEEIWKTGPRSSLTVKSYDDAMTSKQQQATRNTFQSRF
uniref:Integrator complex subunit 7 n=1 Tax=Strigamia maritima TaxID=126957 RepID=T1J6J8_STRMM